MGLVEFLMIVGALPSHDGGGNFLTWLNNSTQTTASNPGFWDGPFHFWVWFRMDDISGLIHKQVWIGLEFVIKDLILALLTCELKHVVLNLIRTNLWNEWLKINSQKRITRKIWNQWTFFFFFFAKKSNKERWKINN